MTEFLHNDDLEDRARLEAFVSFTRETLENILETGRLDPKLRPALAETWAAIVKEDIFGQLLDAIREAPDEALEAHGLLGAHLQLKRAVIKRWHDLHGRSPLTRMLKRLLKSIDNLLRSLLDAVGVGGALDEFKEALSDSLEDDDSA